MNPLWEAVRLQVCRKCIDGDSHGNCRLPGGEFCALQSYFPGVVEVISRTKGSSITTYEEAIRSTICAQCSHRRADNSCKEREALECALDRYLPLIVEKIDSMKMKEFAG